jgi:hypothetical protein
MKSPAAKKNIRKVLRAERHPVSIPVSVGKKTGIAKDISATGIYFEIDSKQKIGSTINFVIDLETPGGPIQFKCSGKVVRVETNSNITAIAATIDKSVVKHK